MLLLASAFFLTLLLCSNAQNKGSTSPADCNTIERDAGVALDLVNRHRRDGYVFGLFRVADAHELRRGNSSILYLTLDVLETECSVLSRRHWESCEYSDTYFMDFGQCKIITYTSQLLKKPQLYGFNCTLSPVPPDLLECKDCPVRIEVLEVTEQHKNIAAKALEKFNSEGNHTNYFNVDKVEKVLKMTASREGHILGFSIKETNCSKSAQQADQALECDFLDDWHAHVGFCKARIISDPDEPHGTDISCEIYHPWQHGHGKRCRYSTLEQLHRHPHHHFGHKHRHRHHHKHHHKHGCPLPSQSRPEEHKHNHSTNEEHQDSHDEPAAPPPPHGGPHHHLHPPHQCPPPPPHCGPHHHHPPPPHDGPHPLSQEEPHHPLSAPPPPHNGPRYHFHHCLPPPPHCGPHHHHPPPPHDEPHPPSQEEQQYPPSAPPPPHNGPHYHLHPPHHCPPPPPHCGPHHHHHPPHHHGPYCPPPPPHGPHHHHPPPSQEEPQHPPSVPPPHDEPHNPPLDSDDGPHCPPSPHGPHHHHPPPHHGPHCPPPPPHGPHHHHPPPHHGPHCPPPPHGTHHHHPPPHHGPHHPPPPGHPPHLCHHYYRHHCNKTKILGKYFPFQVTGAVYRIPVLNQQASLTPPTVNFPELSQRSPHSSSTGEGIVIPGLSLEEMPEDLDFPDDHTQSKSCPGNPKLVLPKILPLFPYSSMVENSPT